MLNRTSLPVAFVVGGIFTLLILMTLRGFAQSLAGMSVGSVPSSSQSDSLTIALMCGYFLGSAFGISASKTKHALWFWAVLVHALLLIAYAMLFASAKSSDPDGYKWPGKVTKLAIGMAVYFSPWLIAWGVILSRKTRKEITIS
jgi:hypothetical protein